MISHLGRGLRLKEINKTELNTGKKKNFFLNCIVNSSLKMPKIHETIKICEEIILEKYGTLSKNFKIWYPIS